MLRPLGWGKFTLFNTLGWLETQTSGRATWRDYELTGARKAELTACRRAHIGFVFRFTTSSPA
jgi:putative ABC transport system ATP-binding protein